MTTISTQLGLQDAVARACAACRAGASAPTEELDDRVTDLAERIEATVARTQRIEATLATLAESFEGVTGGVEEAFGALQSGMAGLALDLARIDTTVAELTAHSTAAPAVDPLVAVRLEELGTAVTALAQRPAPDPATETRLDALAARLDSLGETDEAGELRGRHWPRSRSTSRSSRIARSRTRRGRRPAGCSRCPGREHRHAG